MMGTLTTGTGTFGSINFGDEFSLDFDFTEVVPGSGSINGGMFMSDASDLAITGGTISLIDNGSSDIASFEFETSGPTGTLSVAFLGDGLADNRVTASNLISLINNAPPAPISGNFGASGNFTGSAISAVPEPNSALLLLSATFAVGIQRRRKSRR
ncbi:MAG: hypothetical protein Aurels2KO_45800 [Aureliella sp.]